MYTHFLLIHLDSLAENESILRSRSHPQFFLSAGRKSNMEEVQDELMHRLTLGRSAQKKFPAPPRSNSNLPLASITYDSSPDEVKAWLEAKGFSPVWV